MTKIHNKESGFTLVELAIVMIIIGLLIGGILKGQELIANAQTTATVAQIKGLDGAISTFRDKYSALPGDMPNAGTRLSNCTAAPCTTGAAAGVLGNGRIDTTAVTAAPTLAGENTRAFIHLANSDLISGVDSSVTSTATFGSALPEAKFGGGYWIGYDATAAGLAGVPNTRRGHYLVIAETPAATGAAVANGVTAQKASQIDRKLDDGNPLDGDVISSGTNCQDGTTNLYNEENDASTCAIYIRVQS